MMRNAPDDETLRAAFAALRAADERAAPDFHATHSRRRRRRTTRLSVTRLAVATALLLSAATAYRLGHRERLTVPHDVLALSTWRPGSDVLLDAPVRTLLREPPRLGASLINTRLTGELR